MKILTTIVCVPLLAAFSVLPAQDKKKPAPQKGVITDTAATKSDAAIKEIDAFIASKKVSTNKKGWRSSLTKPPKLKFSKDMDYFWHMETVVGSMKIRYFTDTAPMHVSSGIYLSRLGFYDGLNFHRIIPGFMAQGGCPNSREGARGMAGTGGPGYQIDCEINNQKHQAGTLAMAHAGRNTGGSQFYICYEAQPHLDGVHTVFGLTGNMDVVLKLANGSRINKVTIQ